MAVTYDRLAAFCFILVVGFAVLLLPTFGDARWTMALVAVCLSLPGLALIWFRDELGATPAFSRGAQRTSPPGLVGAFGWLYLVGLPALIIASVLWGNELVNS